MPQPLPACIQRPAILLLREPMGPQAALGKQIKPFNSTELYITVHISIYIYYTYIYIYVYIYIYRISNSAACRSLVFCREKVETVATIPRASDSELVLRTRASQLAPLDCTKRSVACPTSALAALSGVKSTWDVVSRVETSGTLWQMEQDPGKITAGNQRVRRLLQARWKNSLLQI